MNEPETIAGMFFAGALATLLGALVKSRQTRRLVEEVRAAKANTEYRSALEGRIGLLEKHVRDCEDDRKKLDTELQKVKDRNDGLMTENFTLMRQLVSKAFDNLIDNNKPKTA